VSGAPAASSGSRGWPAVNPRDADASCNAGLAALKAGSELQTLPLLDAARAFHPRDPRLWQVTGLLYRSLEDLAPAVAAFEKAAALAPDDGLIAHGYARAALEAGLPAVYLFERAHGIAPLDGAVLLGLAAALGAETGSAAAIALIEEQLARHPAWIPGHALLARLRCVIGERARATESFERALEIAPGETELWRELITTLMHDDRFEDALDAIARARAAAGPHLAFDANEAVCVDELGDMAAADRLFAPLAGVDDFNFLLRRVRHALRAGRPEEAAALAEPVLAGANGNLIAPYLALAWRMQGDPRWAWLEGDERLVGVYDLGDALPAMAAIAARLRKLHTETHAPLEQSVRGGTQTDGELFSRIEPEIRALRRAIVDAVERHVAQLPAQDGAHPILRRDRRRQVRFAGSWSVRLQGGGHHANHIHPQGWFSSAFYVALPEPGGDRAPHAGWLELGAPQKQLGIDLAPTRLIEPKPGRLVLFPSTMWHGTIPFAAGERLTVAFDVAPPH
jgi:tetratricopeptide (TPR) repeat protein